MMPTLLLTDVFLWLLVLGAALYARSVLHNPFARASWALVFRSPWAAASSVVLVFFVAIALLDSIHMRLPAAAQAEYRTPVVSVLDVLLKPLATQQEKSYSAPLAIYGLNKESIEQRHGEQSHVVRETPRLQFAGSHLPSPTMHYADVLHKVWQGMGAGGLAWVLCLWLGWMCRCAWVGHAVPLWRAPVAYHAAQGTVLVVCLVVGVLVFVAPYYHVLGTDKVGVDVLYSALKSVRTAMVIGLLTTLLTLPLGLAAGLVAGYFRGWVDDVIQYIYTTLNAIPSVLLIAAAVLMLQVALEANPNLFPTAIEKADARLFFLCLILGLTSWTGLARLLRGEILKLREQDYVLAARACGVPTWRILAQHLLPNVMHLVLITLVMEFSGLVLAEAVLSYVGVGVDPSTFSYGTLINAARLELSREPMVWWSLAAAFVFMLMLVLAANLFADAVRDAFDPRARQLKQSVLRV